MGTQAQVLTTVLVHGWSVRSTDIYGQLPARLREWMGAEAVRETASCAFPLRT